MPAFDDGLYENQWAPERADEAVPAILLQPEQMLLQL